MECKADVSRVVDVSGRASIGMASGELFVQAISGNLVVACTPRYSKPALVLGKHTGYNRTLTDGVKAVVTSLNVRKCSKRSSFLPKEVLGATEAKAVDATSMKCVTVTVDTTQRLALLPLTCNSIVHVESRKAGFVGNGRICSSTTAFNMALEFKHNHHVLARGANYENRQTLDGCMPAWQPSTMQLDRLRHAVHEQSQSVATFVPSAAVSSPQGNGGRSLELDIVFAGDHPYMFTVGEELVLSQYGACDILRAMWSKALVVPQLRQSQLRERLEREWPDIASVVPPEVNEPCSSKRRRVR